MNKTPTNTELFILQRIDFQSRMITSRHWQSCLNCEYFGQEKDECTLFKARPPSHVIVNGCKDYMDDIPF